MPTKRLKVDRRDGTHLPLMQTQPVLGLAAGADEVDMVITEDKGMDVSLVC
jgi:hypothetical protein